jgi:predicted nucleic acid-binding protein
MATTVVSEPTPKPLSEPALTLTNEIKVFIDTDVLMYNFADESPWHTAARDRIRQLRDMGAEFWISRQVIRELLAVATRPGNLNEPNPVDRWVSTARELEKVLYVAADDEQVTRTLLANRKPGALGRQVHDANIVATMLRYNLSHLLTNNTSDFARYSDRITVLPMTP